MGKGPPNCQGMGDCAQVSNRSGADQEMGPMVPICEVNRFLMSLPRFTQGSDEPLGQPTFGEFGV
jgi:hypothetical protein